MFYRLNVLDWNRLVWVRELQEPSKSDESRAFAFDGIGEYRYASRVPSRTAR